MLRRAFNALLTIWTITVFILDLFSLLACWANFRDDIFYGLVTLLAGGWLLLLIFFLYANLSLLMGGGLTEYRILILIGWLASILASILLIRSAIASNTT